MEADRQDIYTSLTAGLPKVIFFRYTDITACRHVFMYICMLVVMYASNHVIILT